MESELYIQTTFINLNNLLVHKSIINVLHNKELNVN